MESRSSRNGDAPSIPTLRYWAGGILIALSLIAGPVRGADALGMADRLARLVSPNVRSLHEERGHLMTELKQLPVPAGGDTSVHLGWHSPPLPSAGANVWVQVDLGEDREINMIALVAANGEAEDKAGAGYGFPLRFRVEIASNATAQSRTLVGDFTSADTPSPGTYPLLIALRKQRARFVRITATQAWPRKEDWIVALGEIMVLCGEHNVAAGRPVTCSHTATADPYWNPSHLTDQESVLGPPVALESSPSNGYLAIQEPNPQTTKWVQIDLGQDFELNEVRLFPTRPTDFADIPGHGFPVRFRVELSNDPTMQTPVRLFDSGPQPFPNPGENPVTIWARGHHGRYLRVTALELHSRGASSSFALAELQAWAGDRNVALHAPVSCLDQFNVPKFPRWQPDFLVDGYNSRHRLLGYPAWLHGLDRRRQVELALATNIQNLNTATENVLSFTLKACALSTLLLSFAVASAVWRSRRTRRQALEQLRRRVASDLHDEIGSYLGSIRLLSDAGTRGHDINQMRADLADITRIAAQTNESLREIVWLIDAPPVTMQQLVARMRETLPHAAAGLQCSFSAPQLPDDKPCTFDFTRNIWLIFKEALHNCVRHSGCHRIHVSITHEPGRRFVLDIRDDGQGFRESEVEAGRGLHNLRERAAQLGGHLTIASTPGHGTIVRLEIP